MNRRKHVNFCRQGTDLGHLTAIRTLVVFQDHLADGLLLEFINSLIDQLHPLRMLLFVTLLQLILDLADIFLTNLFYICKYSLFHGLRSDEGNHVLVQILRYLKVLIFMFFFSALSNNLIKKFDDLSIYLVSLIDRFDHKVLRHFIGARLDHNHLFPCGRHCKCEVGNLSLISGRVYHQLAVHQTDLCRCRRSVKRDI